MEQAPDSQLLDNRPTQPSRPSPETSANNTNWPEFIGFHSELALTADEIEALGIVTDALYRILRESPRPFSPITERIVQTQADEGAALYLNLTRNPQPRLTPKQTIEQAHSYPESFLPIYRDEI